MCVEHEARGRLVAAVMLCMTLVGVLSSCGSHPHAGPSQGRSVVDPWPGGDTVEVADGADVFGKNLSGLSFERPGVLWAVKNDPATVYRLGLSGAIWTPDSAEGWQSGKRLSDAHGAGDLDAEGVTSTDDGLFVAVEGDNDDDAGRQRILRFDTSTSGGSLTATAQWDLTADVPNSLSNKGIEGITWIPDSYLTAHHLHDDHTDGDYDPSLYPDHGSGLYAVALESNGTVYVYALDQAGGTYTRVASAASGFASLMALEFDAENGQLWAVCDDTCAGRSVTFDIDATGALGVTAEYERPSGMPDVNNEGFAVAAPNTCADGDRQVVWSDDDEDGGHALRRGTLPCVGSGS